MEKMNRVSVAKNGELRLPPGFRFHPTDEELVVQYLKRKALSCPLPASIIPEIDVCRSDPWDLPGEKESERYFFSRREAKYPNGNRSNRATGSGYWKATGLDKRIVHLADSSVVGMKKTLVFYSGKPPHGARTDWIMHEYRLLHKPGQSTVAPEENWVLCRIFLKKRSNKKEDDSRSREGLEQRRSPSREIQKTEPVFYEFLTRRRDLNAAPSSSSSGSSGVTEAAGWNETEGHEESSRCSESRCWHKKALKI